MRQVSIIYLFFARLLQFSPMKMASECLIMVNIFYKEVLVELRKITTIDLASKSANLLEKLLWTLIGITGTIWAAYFITLQVSMISII